MSADGALNTTCLQMNNSRYLQTGEVWVGLKRSLPAHLFFLWSNSNTQAKNWLLCNSHGMFYDRNQHICYDLTEPTKYVLQLDSKSYSNWIYGTIKRILKDLLKRVKSYKRFAYFKGFRKLCRSFEMNLGWFSLRVSAKSEPVSSSLWLASDHNLQESEILWSILGKNPRWFWGRM